MKGVVVLGEVRAGPLSPLPQGESQPLFLPRPASSFLNRPLPCLLPPPPTRYALDPSLVERGH